MSRWPPSRRSKRQLVIAVALCAVVVLVASVYLMSRPARVAVAPDTSTSPIAQSSLSTSTAKERINVAFIGDSYTVGLGATPGHGFTTVLAAAERWNENNFGRGGTGYFTELHDQHALGGCRETFCPKYEDVIPAVVKIRPAIVMVSGGRNDRGHGASEEEASIAGFFRALRQQLPHARILVTSPLWDASVPPKAMGTIAAAVKRQSAAVAAEYLDLGQPLAGRTDLLAADHVHPNDQGYAVIAAVIKSKISRGER